MQRDIGTADYEKRGMSCRERTIAWWFCTTWGPVNAVGVKSRFLSNSVDC